MSIFFLLLFNKNTGIDGLEILLQNLRIEDRLNILKVYLSFWFLW